MSKVRTFVLLLMAALAVAACEQPIMGEAEASEDAEHSEANIILHLSQFEQEDFGTRTAADIAQICSRINIAVFDSEGTKVKSVSQKQSDSEYGTVAMTLASGTYQLVVIAHNGEGSATITSTEVVSFANNKVTDTFYYCGDLIVTDVPPDADRRGDAFKLGKDVVLLYGRLIHFLACYRLRCQAEPTDGNQNRSRRGNDLRDIHDAP